MAVKVASEWLNACSGCEISLLNIGDAILDLIPEKIELVHIPALVDSKYFGPLGDGTELTLPKATVGLISGGVRNKEHQEVAEEMRRKVDILIALGTCATNGGIPAQANMWKNDDVMAKIFKDCPTHDPVDTPAEVVPAYLDNVKAVDEVVKVDIYLPGCPPHPKWIADALLALLDGKTEWALEERSVCDTCPVIREKKSGGGADIKRALENYEYNPDEPIEKMRCIMEQGYLCVGAVTLAGCAGDSGAPRCVQARQACRGCFGPIRKGARPLVDMLGALSSIGQNAQSMVDRRAMLNRFCGAHGNLRPLPPRPGQ
jgi:F420-non-reducing hydrogenase small subunit